MASFGSDHEWKQSYKNISEYRITRLPRGDEYLAQEFRPDPMEQPGGLTNATRKKKQKEELQKEAEEALAKSEAKAMNLKFEDETLE